MKNWSDILEPRKRRKREKNSSAIMEAIESACLTRKQRDPVKRDLMRQLGLPERYPEVQYPSPGNTPNNLEDEEV